MPTIVSALDHRGRRDMPAIIVLLTVYEVDRKVCGMQEPTFLILTALAARPLHGYGVIQSVAELSGGDVRLRAGTLYGALDRLAEQGLVEVDHEEAVEGRLRRYYRLSDSGTAALTAQIERLRRNAAAAEAQLRRRPAGGIVPGLSFGAATWT
jgi:DNA-binding PadR family transcriptional regulator